MRRRAINPILATLFLIIVVIVVGAIYYWWITNSMKSQTQVTQIMIKDKKFIESTRTVVVEVSIRNAGTTDITIISVSLKDPNTQNEIGELSTEMGVAQLGSGEEITYTGIFDKSLLTRGETYLLVIQYKVGDKLNSITEKIKYVATP